MGTLIETPHRLVMADAHKPSPLLQLAAANTQAACSPRSTTGSLLELLNNASNEARTVTNAVMQRSDTLNLAMVKQRKKSREMENAVFGMQLTEVNGLRNIFERIDLDGNGHLDAFELRTALHKAGKIGVTHEKVGRVLTKYDADGSGTLEFDEFQTMVKDWDSVTEELDKEMERTRAAVAAAATNQTLVRNQSVHIDPHSTNQSIKMPSARIRRDRRVSRSQEIPVLPRQIAMLHRSTSLKSPTARQESAASEKAGLGHAKYGRRSNVGGHSS